jgi:hypothetical protein
VIETRHIFLFWLKCYGGVILIKRDTLSFTFIEKFADYSKKSELQELLARNLKDLKPFSPSDLSDDTVKKYIKASDSLIVVHLNTTLVGFSCLATDVVISGYEGVSNNLLVRLSIFDECFRGNGLGRLLYREIESVNKHILKRQFIFRGTWEENLVQHHLYNEFGFSRLATSTYRSMSNLKMCLYVKEVILSNGTNKFSTSSTA